MYHRTGKPKKFTQQKWGQWKAGCEIIWINCWFDVSDHFFKQCTSAYLKLTKLHFGPTPWCCYPICLWWQWHKELTLQGDQRNSPSLVRGIGPYWPQSKVYGVSRPKAIDFCDIVSKGNKNLSWIKTKVRLELNNGKSTVFIQNTLDLSWSGSC